MTAYLEVCLVNPATPQAGLVAFLEPGDVCGAIVPAGLQAWDATTSTKPILVLMRGSRELSIFGPSVAEFLAICERIRIQARNNQGVTTIVCREDYIVQTARSQDGNGFDLQIRYAGSNLDAEALTPQP